MESGNEASEKIQDIFGKAEKGKKKKNSIMVEILGKLFCVKNLALSDIVQMAAKLKTLRNITKDSTNFQQMIFFNQLSTTLMSRKGNSGQVNE